MASGHLKFSPDGIAKGHYSDLRNNLTLAFEPSTEKGPPGSDRPSHDVYAALPGGKLTKCGAAWEKTVTTQGPSRGQKFFSFYVDDPAFGSAINLTAFPVRDAGGKPLEGEFEVVWRRQRREEADAA